MRGTRAKALRTAERPNPGRKGGGSTKGEVIAQARPSLRRVRKMFKKQK